MLKISSVPAACSSPRKRKLSPEDSFSVHSKENQSPNKQRCKSTSISTSTVNIRSRSISNPPRLNPVSSLKKDIQSSFIELKSSILTSFSTFEYINGQLISLYNDNLLFTNYEAYISHHLALAMSSIQSTPSTLESFILCYKNITNLLETYLENCLNPKTTLGSSSRFLNIFLFLCYYANLISLKLPPPILPQKFVENFLLPRLRSYIETLFHNKNLDSNFDIHLSKVNLKLIFSLFNLGIISISDIKFLFKDIEIFYINEDKEKISLPLHFLLLKFPSNFYFAALIIFATNSDSDLGMLYNYRNYLLKNLNTFSDTKDFKPDFIQISFISRTEYILDLLCEKLDKLTLKVSQNFSTEDFFISLKSSLNSLSNDTDKSLLSKILFEDIFSKFTSFDPSQDYDSDSEADN